LSVSARHVSYAVGDEVEGELGAMFGIAVAAVVEAEEEVEEVEVTGVMFVVVFTVGGPKMADTNL
jgi:hypothetical protein